MSQVANTWSNTVVKNIVRTMPPMDNTSSTMWQRAPAGLTNKEKELFSLALNFLSHCVYLLWPYSIILHYHALNCTLRLCFNSVGKYNFNFGLSRHERHNISDQTNQLQSVALTSCRGFFFLRDSFPFLFSYEASIKWAKSTKTFLKCMKNVKC